MSNRALLSETYRLCKKARLELHGVPIRSEQQLSGFTDEQLRTIRQAAKNPLARKDAGR